MNKNQRPPNHREVDCCINCVNLIPKFEDMDCKLYTDRHTTIENNWSNGYTMICDDYERKEDEPRT